jgi:AcrR family transcriptional regulator
MAKIKESAQRTKPARTVEPGRDGILEAAARLFSEKGFDGTSINDLAIEVGLSKATIYHYFPHKNQIYIDVIIGTLAALCEHVEKAIAREKSASDKFLAYAVSHADFFDTNLSAYTATTVGFGGLQHPPERRRAVALRDRHEGNLRSIISDGIKSGEFRFTDPRIATRVLLSSLNWMVRWYKPGGSRSASEFAREFAELLLAGMIHRESAAPASRVTRLRRIG